MRCQANTRKNMLNSFDMLNSPTQCASPESDSLAAQLGHLVTPLNQALGELIDMHFDAAQAS